MVVMSVWLAEVDETDEAEIKCTRLPSGTDQHISVRQQPTSITSIKDLHQVQSTRQMKTVSVTDHYRFGALLQCSHPMGLILRSVRLGESIAAYNHFKRTFDKQINASSITSPCSLRCWPHPSYPSKVLSSLPLLNVGRTVPEGVGATMFFQPPATLLSPACKG